MQAKIKLCFCILYYELKPAIPNIVEFTLVTVWDTISNLFLKKKSLWEFF